MADDIDIDLAWGGQRTVAIGQHHHRHPPSWTQIGIVLAQCIAIEHYKGLVRAAMDYDLRDLPSDADRVCDARLYQANMQAWKLLEPTTLDRRFNVLKRVRKLSEAIEDRLLSAEREIRIAFRYHPEVG